jgi:hypothetical protein
VTFAIAMRMTRPGDGTGKDAFAVSNETEEVSDAELAELLADALRAVKGCRHHEAHARADDGAQLPPR